MSASTYENLVPESARFNVSGRANMKAERLMVLMNHIRRLKNAPIRLRQACLRLDDESQIRLHELIGLVKEYSESSDKPNFTTATPALADAKLDAKVMACKPVPPSKTSLAAAMEACAEEPKHVASIDKRVPALALTTKFAGGKKSHAVAAKDIKYNMTLATKQSYIQYKMGSKKKLLIAVSANMSPKHQQVVKVMYDHFMKNPTLDLTIVKSLRAALVG